MLQKLLLLPQGLPLMLERLPRLPHGGRLFLGLGSCLALFLGLGPCLALFPHDAEATTPTRH